MVRVFSTGKFDLIRVSQYLINGLKGGCKGLEYSKTPENPLSSSTGMTSETLMYHNACTDRSLVDSGHQNKISKFNNTLTLYSSSDSSDRLALE